MEYFCLDCYNEKLVKSVIKPLEESQVYRDWTFCDVCEEWLECVIAVKSKKISGKIKYFYKVRKWKRMVEKARRSREKNSSLNNL